MGTRRKGETGKRFDQDLDNTNQCLAIHVCEPDNLSGYVRQQWLPGLLSEH